MKYVLYHANCYDGFGSAFAAWKKLGDSAKYIPVSYGSPIPEMPNAEEIYILDFSYDAKDIVALSEKSKVILLDHHKTALEKLGALVENPGPNETIIFDMNKSGALLSWEWFHPGIEVPKLIQHISDRDLWKFEIDGSAKIHKALVSYPMDFELWDAFDIETLKQQGETCERLYTQLVDNICSKAWTTEIAGHVVPVVNTSIAWSEIGDTLVKLNPSAPFVASFTIMKNSVMWSLRSRNDFDVSEVAKKFGGGGHKNAAGFKTEKFPEINYLKQ